jgi:hypothetical protein
MSDKKALRILFNTYWSSAGWKRNPVVSPGDFEYARDAGYMFEPVKLSHRDLNHWLKGSLRKVRFEDVSRAFLASLGTRRLELRSALGSFAIARNYPDHTYRRGYFFCMVCGAFRHAHVAYDLSILNFERFKWGGVRHEHPEYIAFDLEEFSKLEIPEPTQRDLDIMLQIIKAAGTCEAQARPRSLERRLADLLDSNKAERDILLQILGYCGILQPPNLPGYFESFVEYSKRTEPPYNRFWTYPFSWWRGEHGVNRKALHRTFPQLA